MRKKITLPSVAEILPDGCISINSTHSVRLEFHIDPRKLPTAQQKGAQVIKPRFGKPFIHFFTKGKVERWCDLFVAALRMHPTIQAALANSKAYAVEIEYWFGYPKSAPKRIRSMTTAMTVRPDLDNLTKGLLDAFTKSGVAWNDDAQIYDLYMTKKLAHDGYEPRVIVYIYGRDIV